ncbi:Alpha-mannosidase 2C1, partial [Apostichopus japonicus]
MASTDISCVFTSSAIQGISSVQTENSLYQRHQQDIKEEESACEEPVEGYSCHISIKLEVEANDGETSPEDSEHVDVSHLLRPLTFLQTDSLHLHKASQRFEGTVTASNYVTCEKTKMAAPLVKHHRTTLERAEKFTSKVYFKDSNLQSRLYTNRMTVPGIFHYAAPGRVPFKAAVTQKFDSVTVGGSYGPTWSTHWFRLEFQIPKAWKSQHVRLQWHSGSEALIWSRDGVPLQGLNPEERI